MRLVADLTRCQGYGQCVYFAPEVFALDGPEALHFVGDPDDGERQRVLGAAACPVQAITVDEPERALRPAATADGRVVIIGASLAG